MPFHILSLSGGGYKGLFTATFLEELEEDIGHPLARKFDLLAGTSIGGIMVLALALEISAKEIKQFFLKKGKQIFSLHINISGGFSLYHNKDIKNALFELFGDKKIGDLKHRIIIPIINYTTGTPQTIKTRHHEKFVKDHRWSLIDVALATSAAPIYFPIHEKYNGDFLDGGLIANNPGLFACIEALKYLDHELEDIYQLHIGTLTPKVTSTCDRRGFGINLKRLISLILSCQEQSSGQIIKILLGDRYYSVDTSVAPNQEKLIKLDKTSNATEKILVQWAHSEGQKFSGSNFYSTIKSHNALPFEPIPLEQGAL
jgi:patatin-like phospholipase/acyl hydrolase